MWLNTPIKGHDIRGADWAERHERTWGYVLLAPSRCLPHQTWPFSRRRTLVHFDVDTEAVFMTTRLAGTATHFPSQLSETDRPEADTPENP
jgi:hypothetical protein